LVAFVAGAVGGDDVFEFCLQVQTMRVFANHEHIDDLFDSFSQKMLPEHIVVFEHSIVDDALAALRKWRGALVRGLWLEPLTLLHGEEEARLLYLRRIEDDDPDSEENLVAAEESDRDGGQLCLVDSDHASVAAYVLNGSLLDDDFGIVVI